MNKQYFKVIDSKGHVFLPLEVRKAANINTNDIVRIGVYKEMVVLEKVVVNEIEIEEKLKMVIKEEQKKPCSRCSTVL